MIRSLPIKSVQDIAAIKSYFRNERTRDYLLFVLGINVPLKLHELLELKCEDLTYDINRYKFNVYGYEIYLNRDDSLILRNYVQHKSNEEYIFESLRANSPITRQQFHRILTNASSAVGYEFSIGPQALKKTFAYHAYLQGVHILDLMHLLGHQSKAETYHFIDVAPQEKKCLELKI
ncbi:tyrosine-type recombinase/integrase [Macrococcus animalis]|uniref:tyrosine-type recombinase/integrase n=1 Tax=Macrococcus animalis TaxID=3395467 RepID=UPI0039BDE675